MSTAKKAICKATIKGPASLADLSTKSLWVQSIEAGKAKELVVTLKECPAGQRALKAVVPQPVDCIIINRASSDGIQEGFCAYIRRCPETECLFLLLEKQHRPCDMHMLGGYDITWETEDEMGEWLRERVENMDIGEQRRFFKKVLNLPIPKKDSDGNEVEDALEYLDNENEDWHDDLFDKLKSLLVDTGYPTPDDEESVVIASDEVEAFRRNGNPMKQVAVFTINEDNW